MASNLSINFRDFLPEAAIVNRDRKEIIRKVMDAYQENYCGIDEQIDGLLQITDVDVADEKYLDYIAALLGLELLGLDTAAQKRSLIKNAVAIYKIKGTNKSWEIIFKTLGFETDIIELWYDQAGALTPIDPMLGHLSPSTGPIIGSITVANINVLPTPTVGDSYIMLDAGTLLLGAVAVTAGDSVEFIGGVWVNQGVPLDPINPDVTLLGRYTVVEINNPALNPLGRLTPAQIAALLSPTVGDTYQLENGGTITLGSVLVFVDDLIKWDGAQWTALKHYKTLDELTADVSRPQPSDGVFAFTTINDITSPGTLPTLTVKAGSTGLWGNDITVEIEDGTAPLTQFNLVVFYQALEVARFDDLSKDLNVNLDNIEININTETFYIDVISINTFGVELRPLNGTYPLSLGANPRNTKSAYIDIILSIEFLDCLVDAAFLNKVGFFDGRVREVKPAHIRIRFKRVDVYIEEPADLLLDDDDLTALIDAELVDVLQPTCDPPLGAVVVYFENGFIRSRSGDFNRFYSVEFPAGLPNEPGAISGVGGYVYDYSGASTLTYGDTLDSLGNPFIYGFTFDPEVCATDELILDSVTTTPFVDDDFYGVTLPQQITYNGTFSFNGYMPFNSSPIDPVTVDGDLADNPDPQGGVTVVRCDPVTEKCILVLDWKYSDT